MGLGLLLHLILQGQETEDALGSFLLMKRYLPPVQEGTWGCTRPSPSPSPPLLGSCSCSNAFLSSGTPLGSSGQSKALESWGLN